MMSRALLCAALILGAGPADGCKQLLAKAKGKDTAEADNSPQTTGGVVTPIGQTSAGLRSPNAPPPGDALLTLGTGEWFNYGPDGPRFAVMLPQRPQESLRPVLLGNVPISAKQATASRIGALYTFIFFDLPATVRTDVRGTLDAVRDDAIRGLPGAVLKGERQIVIGKSPGREFQAEATAQFAMLVTGHVYVVGRRVYEQLITVPSSVGEGGTYVDRFFGSLNAGPEGMGAIMSDQPRPVDTSTPDPAPSPSAKPKKKK